MRISTIDQNDWYTMDIEKREWSDDSECSDDRVPVISFELNNLTENTKYPIPNETSFVMSFEDAKELHAWLGVVLNSH